MRLEKEQIVEIKSVLSSFLKTVPYELFLYGSRVDDNLRGGDIDLLVVTSDQGQALFESKHLDILVQIKKQPHIGQRRIDIKATTLDKISQVPFLNAISGQMIKLD